MTKRERKGLLTAYTRYSKTLVYHVKASGLSMLSAVWPLVLQYSPPRSGSTLVFNILRDVLRRPVVKSHSLVRIAPWSAVVCTYRNPLDCIASSLQLYGLNVDEPVPDARVESLAVRYDTYLDDVMKLSEQRNALLLKYEDFRLNYDCLYSRIAEFFAVNISDVDRQSMSRRYSVTSMRQKADTLGTFDQVDRKTGLHGNHISRFDGGEYHAEVLTQAQVASLNSRYDAFLRMMGYLAD